jgi:hypothetical protein
VDVSSIRAGELQAEPAEVNADGQVGLLERVVEIAAVDEEAHAIQRCGP